MIVKTTTHFELDLSLSMCSSCLVLSKLSDALWARLRLWACVTLHLHRLKISIAHGYNLIARAAYSLIIKYSLSPWVSDLPWPTLLFEYPTRRTIMRKDKNWIKIEEKTRANIRKWGKIEIPPPGVLSLAYASAKNTWIYWTRQLIVCDWTIVIRFISITCVRSIR